MARVYVCDCVLFCYNTVVKAEDREEAEAEALETCRAETADDYDCECWVEDTDDDGEES